MVHHAPSTSNGRASTQNTEAQCFSTTIFTGSVRIVTMAGKISTMKPSKRHSESQPGNGVSVRMQAYPFLWMQVEQVEQVLSLRSTVSHSVVDAGFENTTAHGMTVCLVRGLRWDMIWLAHTEHLRERVNSVEGGQSVVHLQPSET
jgi:hypothetical protein